MKKIIAITLISMINVTSAMDKKITLRSAEEIKADFEKTGTTQRAINRLDFHNEFGGKTMSIQEIESKIQEICQDRIERTPQERREWAQKHVQEKLPEATTILLNAHPQALQLIMEQRKQSQ